MKIAIATVQVPFISGGAEILVNMLKSELIKRGHNAEIVSIPFKWYPKETLYNSMEVGKLIDLTEVNGEKIDKVIAMKFPAYYLKHDNKVIWLMHQHRQAYDLWNTQYGDLHLLPNGNKIRKYIKKNDDTAFREAKKIYTIAQNTSRRLKKYNDFDSEVLYHPPLNYEKLHCSEYGDFIFYASRIDQMKRQRLLVEAACYIKTNVKIVIAGSGSQMELNYINDYVAKNNLKAKVNILGFISEEEKINCYANCLGVYFGAYDEDYGYITLESFFAKKPIIVHKDAGGPLEFVEDGVNGYVIDNDPKLLAQKIDNWYTDKKIAANMGEAGYLSLKNKHIDWDYVIEKLLQ